MKTEFTFPSNRNYVLTGGNHVLTGVPRDRGVRGYQSVWNYRCVLSEHGADEKGRQQGQPS
jgi:hypothetical protein